MRGGAGRVHLAVPTSTAPVVSARLLEALVHGLREDRNGCHTEYGAETVVRLAMRNGALAETIVLGPGMGNSPGEVSFARAITRAEAFPLVITAGAFSANASGEALEELAGRSGPTVIVAGPDGSARLLGEGTPPGSMDTGSAARRILWRIAASPWYCSKETTLSSCHPAAPAR